MSDLNAFLVLSTAIAFMGWGIVYLSSRIERQRQERHAERFGEKVHTLIEPSAWVRFLNARRSS
jgi:hypothetical protein